MTLAQVQATVAVFLGLVASLTGLFTATAVLLPAHAERAEKALDLSPKRVFMNGLAMALLVVIALFLLNIPNPIVKFFGFGMLLMLTALATLGGAGIVQLMGRRIGEMTGARSNFGCLVRGSLAYSLGIFCPYVGWLLFGPISLLFALGAGRIALTSSSGRLPAMPKTAPEAA